MQRRILAPVAKSLLLFLLFFGLQQGMNLLAGIYAFPAWLQNLLYLPTHILLVYVCLLFMKTERLSFQQQGFLMPHGASMYFSIALLLALAYTLVTIFLPGILAIFENLPTASLSSSSLLIVGGVVLSSLATETAFRGYVHTNLKRSVGFFPALLINSIMSTAVMTSLPFYSEATSPNIFYSVPILFAENAFLSIFFEKAKTLLCTITYSATTVLLYVFTPLRAFAGDYIAIIQVAAYILFIPIMLFLVGVTAKITAGVKPLNTQ